MINPFRKSVILKAQNKIFKGQAKEKQQLARDAGDFGYSNRQMDKKLKENGYDPKKRAILMAGICGKKPENKILTEMQKRRNIQETRMIRDVKANAATRAGISSRLEIKEPKAGLIGQRPANQPIMKAPPSISIGKRPIGF